MRRTAPWPTNLAALPAGDPSAPAIVDRTGEERRLITYAELEDRAARFAGGLAGMGIGAGDRVATLGENAADWLIALLGVVRLGAVVVPLNPRLPDEVLVGYLDDVRPAAILADDEHRARFPGARPLALDGPPMPVAAVDPREPALILATSGSTGRAKGVVASHRSQVVAVEGWATWETSRTMTTTLVAAPLCHKNGLGEAKVALAIGAAVVLQRRFDARAYLEAAAEEGCSTLSGVPTMFARMLAREDLLARLDLSAVRGLNVGSAPFTEALAARIREVFPHAHVFNSYGTTEAPAVFGDGPDGTPGPRTSVGMPLASVDVRLVGPDGTDANPGELWVRGEGVADGYLGLSGETAERFVDGAFRTRDVLRRDEEGWYHYVGRSDDMAVVGGENVYPGAVTQLLEDHPGVRQAAVVFVPDEERGAIPVAFVVSRDDPAPTEEDLQAWTLARGPAAAHPRAVWFVDALPLGATEKVDVASLIAEARHRLDR